MSDAAQLPGPHQKGFGATERKDAWWAGPIAVGALLLAFIVYSTAVAFQSGYHWVNGTNYLSPFYSPEIYGNGPHAWISGVPSWWPKWMFEFSSAFLILAVPAGFRLTCYYYRKAYYRSLWLDPVACAVGEPRNSYWGENTLPLILWNAHRYFLYLAIVLGFILLYDGIAACFFPVNADGSAFFWSWAGTTQATGALPALSTSTPIAAAQPAGYEFGLGVGSIILLLNPLFIMGYTFGCHSLRHLVGGRKDGFGCSKSGLAQLKAWRVVSWLNEHHNAWAMASLVWVGVSGRLCAPVRHGRDHRLPLLLSAAASPNSKPETRNPKLIWPSTSRPSTTTCW